MELKDPAGEVVELEDSLLWKLIRDELRDQIIADLIAAGGYVAAVREWLKRNAAQAAAAVPAGAGIAAETAAAGGGAGAAVVPAAWLAALVGAGYLGYRTSGATVRAGRKDAGLILNSATAKFKHRRVPELDDAVASTRKDTIDQLRTTGLAERPCRG
ncbi:MULTISPECIES: hypothetical protein [unclassified Frankia]